MDLLIVDTEGAYVGNALSLAMNAQVLRQLLKMTPTQLMQLVS